MEIHAGLSSIKPPRQFTLSSKQWKCPEESMYRITDITQASMSSLKILSLLEIL